MFKFVLGHRNVINNAGGFEGNGREGKTLHVSEEVNVDDQIGSCAG